jgi:hypothetical protein
MVFGVNLCAHTWYSILGSQNIQKEMYAVARVSKKTKICKTRGAMLIPKRASAAARFNRLGRRDACSVSCGAVDKAPF